MPKIRFTDAEVRKLPLGPLTWYSHEGDRYPGLRLGVTKTAETWYLSKRNPHIDKVLSVKLGRFLDLSVTVAAERAAADASRIDNGTAIPEAAHDSLPTWLGNSH